VHFQQYHTQRQIAHGYRAVVVKHRSRPTSLQSSVDIQPMHFRSLAPSHFDEVHSNACRSMRDLNFMQRNCPASGTTKPCPTQCWQNNRHLGGVSRACRLRSHPSGQPIRNVCDIARRRTRSLGQIAALRDVSTIVPSRSAVWVTICV